MTDLAGDWLASLPPAGVATFDAVKTSFDARYKTPEMVKYRSAKEIFSRKQQPTEITICYLNTVSNSFLVHYLIILFK